MRPLRTTATVLLLALVPLAACGDDDDAAEGPLTKAEFIAAGDEICRDAEDDGEALDAPTEDAEDLSRWLDEASDVLEGAAEDFEALDPPGDGEEVHGLYVDALRESVDVLGEAKAAADAGDVAEAQRIVEEADPEVDSREPTQAYGFEVCGAP